MQKTINSVLHNPAIRAVILVVLVIPISAYLGTSPVRRGFLYYAGVFAPSIVAAVAAGCGPGPGNGLTCGVLTVAHPGILAAAGVTDFRSSRLRTEIAHKSSRALNDSLNV